VFNHNLFLKIYFIITLDSRR